MGRKNKGKVDMKMAFYKRTRRDNPGMQNDAIRALWAQKVAQKKARDEAKK